MITYARDHSVADSLNYVAICVIGGVQVATGQMSRGDVQAFIQSSRQFTMPIVQTASIMNVLQSAVANAGLDGDVDANRLFVADGPIVTSAGIAWPRSSWSSSSRPLLPHLGVSSIVMFRPSSRASCWA